MSSGARTALLAGVLGAGLLVVAGCGASGGAPSVGGGPGSAGGVRGTVTVLAAASLTESFTTIGRDFEAAHPGTRVRFSFAGSSQLARQIVSGAPADVFAAANPATMATVGAAGEQAGEPLVFARNQLVIAVPAGNPRGLTGLASLARPGTKVALCAEQVPCGSAARQVLAAAGVTVTPVTLEQDVRAALAKVRLGEVDAALVYRTDGRVAAGDVDVIEFPESVQAVNDYPVVALRGAPNPAGAAAFVGYVRSGTAKSVLAAAGFEVP